MNRAAAREARRRLGASAFSLLLVAAGFFAASDVRARDAGVVDAAEDGPSADADVLADAAEPDYQAGHLLYERGDYAGALERFETAARTSDDPRLVWDEAACEAALQHYARAGRFMHRYLALQGSLISPDAAQKAHEFIEETEARSARLLVTANEPGGEVSVDGEILGTLPLRSDLRVDPGAHTLRVRKTGFADTTLTFSATGTADVSLQVALVPLPPPHIPRGRLAIRAGKGNAIEVDGTLVGLETWTGTVEPGPHAVRVTAQDSVPFESSLMLGDDEVRSLDVTLQPTRRAAGVPAWIWIAGGTVLAAGAVTAGYFLFKSNEPPGNGSTGTSFGTVQLP